MISIIIIRWKEVYCKVAHPLYTMLACFGVKLSKPHYLTAMRTIRPCLISRQFVKIADLEFTTLQVQGNILASKNFIDKGDFQFLSES